MRLQVVAFGKLKTPGLRDAADYYIKIIQPWFALKETELRPERVEDKSGAERARVQEAEASLLQRTVSGFSARRSLILLDEMGPALKTEQWAELLESRGDQGIQDLCFCIGGSLGFASPLRKSADRTVSLGAQTLPHGLARVVLLEQLYRAASVLKGHPYHNAGA